MTAQQLLNFLAATMPKITAGKKAWADAEALLARVARKVDPDDDLNANLSQAEIDRLVAIYQPLWQEIKTRVEAAGDSINSDN